MLQLGYSNMYIDPETEIGMEDPGWYGAAYYAITCTDYGTGSGTPDERADRILDEARALAPEAPVFSARYFLERFACAYWPHQGPDTRPAPYAGRRLPDARPERRRMTRSPRSRWPTSVLDNARNAYGVFMQGGPHVIWGRGFACPDTIVQALLYDGTLPTAREQRCEQDPDRRTTTPHPDRSRRTGRPFAVARAVQAELLAYIPLPAGTAKIAATFGCPISAAP
jgi:hypothetical protein